MKNHKSLKRKDLLREVDTSLSTFMLRRLHPWFENIAKRQVKSTKIYFRDSWEGFVLEQFLRFKKVRMEDAFFGLCTSKVSWIC